MEVSQMAASSFVNAPYKKFYVGGGREIGRSDGLIKEMHDVFEYKEDRQTVVRTVYSWIEFGEQVKRGEFEIADCCVDSGRQAFAEYIKRDPKPFMEFYEFMFIEGTPEILCVKDESDQLLRLQQMEFEWGCAVLETFRLFACNIWHGGSQGWVLMLPEEY
jgi:hypothetical protein